MTDKVSAFREVDIVMPTLSKMGTMTEDSLHHIPFKYKLYKSAHPGGWPQAINECLEERKKNNKSGELRDVIIVDDDIKIFPNTFKNFEMYLPHADVFGFKLTRRHMVVHDGTIYNDEKMPLHFCYQRRRDFKLPRLFRSLYHIVDHWKAREAGYVAHVTASLCYIKSEVLDKVSFPVWPGSYWEDTAFTLEAWKKGFKVLYCPMRAYHENAGTKGKINEGEMRWMSPKCKLNQSIFMEKYSADIMKIKAAFDPFNGKVPLGQNVQPF